MLKITEILIVFIHLFLIISFIIYRLDKENLIIEPMKNKFYYISVGILIISSIIFIGSLIFDFILKMGKAKWNIFFSLYTKGILWSYFVTIILRLVAYRLALFSKENKRLKNLKRNCDYNKDHSIANIFKSFCKYILSFDYLVAEIFTYFLRGKNLKEIKVKKGNLIKFYNWFNLAFVLVLASLSFFDKLPIIFKGFIVYRTFSRSMEIIFSFYADVATRKGSKEKTSSLNRYDRISLAVFSYLEMVVSFALIYSFYGIGDDFSLAIIESLKIMIFMGAFSDCYSRLYLQYIMGGQIFVSLTLVLFALAGYLGDDDNEVNKYIELKPKHKN